MFHATLAGYFKIEAIRPDGEVKVLADWFPNLILNQGLERIGAGSDWMDHCHVGAGSTAPAATQTGLVSIVSGASTVFSTNAASSGVSPWYTYKTRVYQFGVGVAEGNLQEVGVGWANAGSTLFSRALILDSGASPATITVLSDEILKVTYQFRRYISEVDTTGSVTLNSIDYAYTGRVANIGDAGIWGAVFRYNDAGTYSLCSTFNGGIGTIETQPSNVSGDYSGSVTISAYVPTSYTAEWRYDFGLTQGNATTGIMAIKLDICGGKYQIEFDPVIPKTIDDTLSLTFQCTWARHA